MHVEGNASDLVRTLSSISGLHALRECPALRFEMTNESVFHSHQSTPEKGRMTWNAMNWKPLFAQSLCFESIPFCFTICEVHMVQFLVGYSAMAFMKSFGRCYQDNTLSDDVVMFFKGRCLL